MSHPSMRPILLLLSILLSSWVPSPGHAQSIERAPAIPAQGSFLALDQALGLALRIHPSLQDATAAMQAATARTEQNRSAYYPTVTGSADTTFGAGRVNPRFIVGGALLQPNQSIFVTGVIATQRIYDFGYTQSLVESSALAERAQEQDIQARRALVTLNVQRAYLWSLKRRRLVEIAEETVRERGILANQMESLYRQQLKSKLDWSIMRVELTNAESILVKARNDLKASFADLNRAMGLSGGAEDYVLEDIPTEVTRLEPLDTLISDSLSHPELKRAKEAAAAAEAHARAAKRRYLPTIEALASGGTFEPFDPRQAQQTGGWWAAGAHISMPLFTGFLIENQVREATAQYTSAQAQSLDIEQALTQQVTTVYLDTVTFAQHIKLAEEQVRTAQEALQLARQRYKLGLSSIVEVTTSEVALRASQNRLADAQYDYKIAEVTLAYAAGKNARLQIDPTIR